jgi:predicted nucleic acid-binding protein
MILDSSFLIDLERSHEPAVTKAREIEADELPRRVPLIVIYEMFISVGKGTRTEENRKRVERVLGSLPIVSANEAIVRRAGRFEGEVQRTGLTGVGPADAIIAATAIEYDEPVLTDDATDFERIPSAELRIEAY